MPLCKTSSMSAIQARMAHNIEIKNGGRVGKGLYCFLFGLRSLGSSEWSQISRIESMARLSPNAPCATSELTEYFDPLYCEFMMAPITWGEGAGSSERAGIVEDFVTSGIADERVLEDGSCRASPPHLDHPARFPFLAGPD